EQQFKINQLVEEFHKEVSKITEKQMEFRRRVEALTHPVNMLTTTDIETKFEAIDKPFTNIKLHLIQQLEQAILQVTRSSGVKKRTPLPPVATEILSNWYNQHIDYPYPTQEEKLLLAQQCGISVQQVTTWFNNR